MAKTQARVKNDIQKVALNNVIGEEPKQWVEGKTKDSPSTVKINAKIARNLYGLRRCNEAIKTIQKQADQLKLNIQKYMAENELLLDSNGKALVTLTFQDTNEFETIKFKAEHPDLYKNYLTMFTSRVFVIKDNSENF